MKTYYSLLEVLDAFPTEEACVRHLEALRAAAGHRLTYQDLTA